MLTQQANLPNSHLSHQHDPQISHYCKKQSGSICGCGLELAFLYPKKVPEQIDWDKLLQSKDFPKGPVMAAGRSAMRNGPLAFHRAWHRACLSFPYLVSRSVASVRFFFSHLLNERYNGVSAPWESGQDAGKCWASLVPGSLVCGWCVSCSHMPESSL